MEQILPLHIKGVVVVVVFVVVVVEVVVIKGVLVRLESR